MKTERILMAGAGGQGVILLGKLLATIALDHVRHVTFLPSYGAEVRGGTSNCQIILAGEPIASPAAERFDSVLVMNQASTDRFLRRLAPRGLAIVNRSMSTVPPASRAVQIRATEVADKRGDTRAANFVMLGAWVARRQVLPIDSVQAGIRSFLADRSPGFLDVNIRAFTAGLTA